MRCRLALIFALLLTSGPIAAQIGNPADFNNRLLRLENELDTLSRQVYRGGGAQTPSGQSMPPASAANMELRLSQVEAQIRQLTGQVEQQGFLVNQLRDQLNRLTTDLDYRLRSLETAGAETASAATRQLAADPAGSAAAMGSSPPGAPGGQNGAERPQDPDAIGAEPAPQADMPGQSLGTLPAPGSAAADPRSMPQTELAGMTPEAIYEEAFAALGRADYPRAEALFVGFLEQHGDHRLSGNARYWLSESYFVRGAVEQAAVGFAEGYQLQPDGPKAADNLLKLGIALGQLGRTEQACSTFAQLAQQFPDLRGTLARRAQRESNALGCGG